MISQIEIEDNEGAVASIYGLSKDESSLICRLENNQLIFVPISLLKNKDSQRYLLVQSFRELSQMSPNTQTYPVIEETPVITKRKIETTQIQIKKTVQEIPKVIAESLSKEEYEIETVALNEVREEPVQMRVEGEVTIIPVQEEIIVVQKKILIREEIRIRKLKTEQVKNITLHLKKEFITIDRKKLN